jgi:hypothetical protein
MTGADDTAVPVKPDWMAQSYWDNESLTRKRQMADAEATRIGRMRVTDVRPSAPVSMRRQLLNEAADLIDGGRDREYGGPEKNFERIAALWNAAGFCHGGVGGVRPIAPHDVAILMIMVKAARLIVSPRHKDSWTDIGGYAGCGFEVAEGE